MAVCVNIEPKKERGLLQVARTKGYSCKACSPATRVASLTKAVYDVDEDNLARHVPRQLGLQVPTLSPASTVSGRNIGNPILCRIELVISH